MLVNKYRSIGESLSNLVYVFEMSGRKKKKSEASIFDSIRKPTAPPGQKFGRDKPEDKQNPAGRKSKHKKKSEESN